jgi:hypothetical protein
MESSKAIEEFKRMNEALNQSLSYENYVFFLKCRSKVLSVKLGDSAEDQPLSMFRLRTEEWVGAATEIFAEMYSPTVCIQRLSKRMQEVRNLIEVPAYTFVFHSVAEHSHFLKATPPSKLERTSNCGSFSRLRDATKLTRSSQSFSSLLMGRSLDSTLKAKLEASRKEVSSLASEVAHYRGEVGRLQHRVEELQGDKEQLEGYLRESVQLSDSLIAKYDSLTKENDKLKLSIAQGSALKSTKPLVEKQPSVQERVVDSPPVSTTELKSENSKESIRNLPPAPDLSKERKTPSPTEQEGEGELCKAIMDYVGETPDLLSLRQGDLIWMTAARDGWLYGENINSGAVGLFPAEAVSRSPEV